MASKLSRTRLARYVATELQNGNSGVIRELAAYLIDEGRTSETELVLRSIYDELERDGIVLAEVTTAHGIDTDTKAAIKQLLGARQLELREQTDKSVLGGLRVITPSRVLDATLRNRLTKLHERKV